MFRKLDGVDHNQPGYHHASGWNAALRQVMDVLRAQTFSTQAQPEALSETLESARWRNALVGLCDTDRIDTPEQAIANVKRRMRPMGLAQQKQPVSGADGLTDAAIEMLAKQYDCHNAPGFMGFAKAAAALAQQDADKVDAERYRWLRERSNHAAPVQVARYFGPCYRSGTRIYGADIDAAIDAARKEQA